MVYIQEVGIVVKHMMITAQKRIKTMAMVRVCRLEGMLGAGRPAVICALEGLTASTGPGTMTGQGYTHTGARP